MSARRLRPGSSIDACRVSSKSSRTIEAIRSSFAGSVIVSGLGTPAAAASAGAAGSDPGATGTAWTTFVPVGIGLPGSLMGTNLAPPPNPLGRGDRGRATARAEVSEEQGFGEDHPFEVGDIHALVDRVRVRSMIAGADDEDLDPRTRV